MPRETHDGRVSMLCDIIALSADFGDSPGKHFLWCTLLALTTTTPAFLEKANSLAFINDKLGLFKCPHGMIVYTSSDGYWVAVNIVIPSLLEDTPDLVAMFANVFHNDAFVVDWTPINACLKCPFHGIRPSRFIDDYSLLESASVVKNRLHFGTRSTAVSPMDVADISKYRPITLSSKSENDAELFWAKINGKIMRMTNPRYKSRRPLVFEQQSVHRSSAVKSSTIRLVVDAFDGDMSTEAQQTKVLRVLGMTSVPIQIRRHISIVICTKCGVDDDKVKIVAQSLEPIADYDLEFAYTMVSIYRVMVAGVNNMDNMFRFFRQIANEASHSPAWRVFMRKSQFLKDTVSSLPPEFVKRIVHLPYAADLCAGLMRERIGKWSKHDMERVHIMVHLGVAAIDLQDALDALLREWDKDFDASYAPVAAPVVSEKQLVTMHEEVAAEAVDENVVTEIPSPPQTYEDVVRRMARKFGVDVTLIGSGIFFDAHDIDVVIRVNDDEPLNDAYERVAAITGWQQKGIVDGEHTVILTGTYDGIQVDAQIWRGARGITRAEDVTASAVDMSEILRCNRSAFASYVRCLHSWAEAASVKSHMLCALPGVAVTCIAIAFAARRPEIASYDDAGAIRMILRDLHACLETTEIPCIDLDDGCTNPRHGGERVVSGLRVTAKGHLLNTRMTCATTRALQLVVKESIDASDDQLFCAEYYNRLRAKRAIYCGTCTSTSGALHLKRIACALDKHPLVSGLSFVKQGVGVSVFVDLQSTTDKRHRFTSEPTLIGIDNGFARVKTTQTRLPYVLLPVLENVVVPKAANLGSPVRLADGTVVPNVPFLVLDVRAAFGALWDWQ